jgi:hypothetical protein
MPYNFQLSDDDFARINEDAEQYRKEYKERGFQVGVPVCFLGDGNYIFRLYPDRDAKGFARVIKKAWIHTGITVEEKKLRFWSDERVNKLFAEAEEAGLEKIFGKPIYQFKSREQGYIMAHMYECPETEYTKPGNTYATVVNRRQMFAIQDFIAELHPDDKRAILDPNNPAPGIKLQNTKGSGKANVSCGIAGMQKLTLPALEFKDDDGNPIEYNGLDQVYITENDKISDEDFFKLRNMVYTEIANFKASGGLAKDKSAEGHKFSDKALESPAPLISHSTGPSQAFHASQAGNLNPEPRAPQEAKPAPEAPKAAAASSTAPALAAPTTATGEEIRCRLADQCKSNPKMAEAYPDARFGNHPEKSTPYCLACSFEEECTVVTAKAKKAA